MLIYKYMHNNSQTVTLEAVAKPDKEFKSLMDPLAAAHIHEQYVTGLINAIYAAAQAVNDFRTVQFLDWFAKALYMLNRELAGRTYSAPSLQL